MMLHEVSIKKDGVQLTPIETESKNNLPVGTILKLNGYSNPRFVIVENLGVDTKYAGYGSTYICINLETLGIHRKQSHQFKFITEKKDDRIQTYILNEPLMNIHDLQVLYEKAIQKEKEQKAAQDKVNRKAEEIKEKGKAWFEKNRPSWAKSVIVGYKEIDDCDMMTDYFATKSGKPYLLAWSKHTRDIFSEMRKAAGNMEKTKHLSVKPDVNSGGEKKTDQNKSWWRPADEHREKYSMGAGYYLKSTGRYSTGWKVCKWSLSKWRLDQIYTAAGEGRVFIPNKKTQNKSIDVDIKDITITENEEKNGVEIRFPGKPSEDIRDKLKSNGFRWSRFSKCWYKKRSDTTLAFAQSFIN